MSDIAFWVFAVAAIITGWGVFRVDSMVRASFLLLASFLNVAAIFLLLSAEFLGFALIFMMAVEMMVMAIFMVMFMMNPAGLNPMSMFHQPRLAIGSGIVAFGALTAVALAADFPSARADTDVDQTPLLGRELLGDSMLIFESAGVTLLAAIVVAVILSTRGGRHGDAITGSLPPPLDPDGDSGDGHEGER